MFLPISFMPPKAKMDNSIFFYSQMYIPPTFNKYLLVFPFKSDL